MDDFLLRSRMTLPVTTGTPGVPVQRQTQQNGAPAATPFRQMLERTAEEDGLTRLRDGMEIARDKGLQDALILMEGSAFIVSAKNSTVITAMNSQELKNKVITNIDGTVIL